MSQAFKAGDFLIFQLEAGYGLLRVLYVEQTDRTTWHLAAYRDLFLDVETAEATIERGVLGVDHPHLALTDRAFESTQVAKISHTPLTPEELEPLNQWNADPNRQVSDRSVRLLLGLR